MKIDICNQLDSFAAIVSLFVIKNIKITKNILNKKALATGTSIVAALMLQFLQAKKQK